MTTVTCILRWWTNPCVFCCKYMPCHKKELSRMMMGLVQKTVKETMTRIWCWAWLGFHLSHLRIRMIFNQTLFWYFASFYLRIWDDFQPNTFLIFCLLSHLRIWMIFNQTLFSYFANFHLRIWIIFNQTLFSYFACFHLRIWMIFNQTLFSYFASFHLRI